MSGLDARVLIVGAGPVGLTVALRLAQFGVPCTVIEAQPCVSRDLRASTFHPPTLDFLDEYGLAAPLIALGRKCPTWQVRMHDTHERAQFDLAVLADLTRHPYRLQCEQFKLSELLVERLAASPLVRIEWDARVTNVRQTPDAVYAEVSKNGETFELEGSLLIGADGARSRVREIMGVAFAGATYPETTLLAVTTFAFEEHLPGLADVSYVWSREGTFSLLHLPSVWRCSLYPDAGQTIEEALSPEAIECKLQQIVAHPAPYEVLEARAYRVHKRIVSDYRIGRVVLVGDAAHINSPSGGMGMNGGIHDAFNLTEKIRDIAHAGAGLDLLDLYTRQRRPVAAQEILAQADRNRSRMQERDPAKRLEILKDLQRTASDPALARAYLSRSSMLDGLKRAERQA